MIQRLRDTRAPQGSPEAELADVVASMEPMTATAARQQRILQAVAERTRWRRSRFPALLRPALAGAILLGAGVAATAATVGHDWVTRQWRELTGHSDPAVAPPLRAKPAASVARPAAIEVPVAAADATPMQVEPAPEPPAPVRPTAVRAAAHARLVKGEDPTALVEAVRALRGDHDPGRAARLLDAYRRTYPRGALAEEALALQIEAAAALHSPGAGGFAQQYLRAYPNGRFCEMARQALASRP